MILIHDPTPISFRNCPFMGNNKNKKEIVAQPGANRVFASSYNWYKILLQVLEVRLKLGYDYNAGRRCVSACNFIR